jgi:hypothetical protein
MWDDASLLAVGIRRTVIMPNPAKLLDELFDAWLKQGPRAIDNLIRDRPADFVLALMEAVRIEREGHMLQ